MPRQPGPSRWPPLTYEQKVLRQAMRDAINSLGWHPPLTGSKLAWVLIRLPPDAQAALGRLLMERDV